MEDRSSGRDGVLDLDLGGADARVVEVQDYRVALR
jgi:hypothetical protein